VAPGLGPDSTLVGAAERAFGALLGDPLGTLAPLLTAAVTPPADNW
jgi:hypothetical protein